MTGMRGEPCIHLHQDIEMCSGTGTYYCKLLGLGFDVVMCGECNPGSWCPLVGDKRYHIVEGNYKYGEE